MYTDIVCRGTVVRSTSGRDKHRIFMVTGACDDGSLCVMIADGALHTLSKPKKKNLRHLVVLAAADEEKTSNLSSDMALKAFLDAFEERGAAGGEYFAD